ncbi:hypothetical protein ACFPOE_16720 [Caenimonas terrae]|uniref:DUF4124 domain-containing protein n=1 Tax=Caenimonas terrae TaxID=696074 RepID=A0ABW0NJ60_9BURK
MKLKLALFCAIGLASVNAMACYTVYDRDNHVVYNSQTPPVDMSRPLHETVPVRFPGGSMIFDASTDCPSQAPVKVALPQSPSRPSPLLTDRRTAAAMHAPHTILPSGVALISQPTPVMVAGLSSYSSASPAPVAAPAVLAQRRARAGDTVITELHNPPLTVVQQGGMVVSELR